MENNLIWRKKIQDLLEGNPRLRRLETPEEVYSKLKDRFIIKVV
jgi:hypothetical protein